MRPLSLVLLALLCLVFAAYVGLVVTSAVQGAPVPLARPAKAPQPVALWELHGQWHLEYYSGYGTCWLMPDGTYYELWWDVQRRHGAWRLAGDVLHVAEGPEFSTAPYQNKWTVKLNRLPDGNGFSDYKGVDRSGEKQFIELLRKAPKTF